MLTILGRWILHFYYWGLWNLGFPDIDGNYNTLYDRFPITYILRNQKARLQWLWYLPVGLTFYLSYEWLCHINLTISIIDTVLGILSIPWFILITWLFIHVDLTTDTGIFRNNTGTKQVRR